MEIERIKTVFGDIGERYVALVNEFREQLPDVHYTPATQDELAALRFDTEEDRRNANISIWRDQLTKVHIAAVTTVLRNARWIEGMLAADANTNLMAFGACFRGLIEAAADSFESLRNIPFNLGNNFETIRECLEGTATEKVHVSADLEELVDHYIHAQKRPKGFQGPEHMRAKTARDYVNSLQGTNQGKIIDAYADLCEITHPASLTVTVFLKSNNDALVLEMNPDRHYIEFLIDEYRQIMPRVLNLSLNPAFMTLRVINLLPMTELHIQYINTLNFDESEDWLRLKGRMGIE